ncbi:MAG: muramoyltetrapeptide carboxypeptidase [Nocardioidaceae bacterium]|nr:muramoyltetrapeptide carboxypeptidase [Nocardioidaceae bacterium]
MTLLIDPPNAPGHGRLWSHLASDSSYDELHRFAQGLGIPQRGFDRDHYDVPAERYDAVVAAGAVPVSSRDLIDRLRTAGLRRRKPQTPAPKKPGRPLIRATRLHPGDRVAVVAPAGPVVPERLEAGLSVLRSWDLQVTVAPHARGTHERFTYLAADDAARAHDFTQAWTDPEVSAVFCTRGGYGVQRMLDLLDWPSLAAAGPTVLVGFSDVTALHQAVGARLGVSTIHGPVVTSLGRHDEDSRSHLRSILFDPRPGRSLTPTPAERLVGGRAEGVLVGGNLALLAAGVGTRSTLSAAESIVVLEEVGEEVYRLDRLLTQLLRSGWFDGARGIALGQFTDCASPEAVRDLLVDRLAPLGLPTILGAPFGHALRNLAFPLGVPAVLDADAGTLVLREAALL